MEKKRLAYVDYWSHQYTRSGDFLREILSEEFEITDFWWKPNNKIPLNDSYRQYLNYYLGWGNYAKKVYKTDKKAIIFAKSVEKQSKIYKSQLRECQKSLDRNKYIIF